MVAFISCLIDKERVRFRKEVEEDPKFSEYTRRLILQSNHELGERIRLAVANAEETLKAQEVTHLRGDVG